MLWIHRPSTATTSRGRRPAMMPALSQEKASRSCSASRRCANSQSLAVKQQVRVNFLANLDALR